MFSNPKVTFTPPPLPLLSTYLSPPFTLYISHFLFFSPLFTLCKPKVTGFMGCMHDVGKCQVVDFFPFHSPPFPPVVFLIFCWLVWLRVWTYLFIQVSANKHDIFIVRSRSFGFGGSCFNCGRSEHRASKCSNKEDF